MSEGGKTNDLGELDNPSFHQHGEGKNGPFDSRSPSPAPTGESTLPGAAPLLSSRRNGRRYLRGVIQGIEQRVASGQPVTRSLQRASKRMLRRGYRGFSFQNLRGLYYEWQRCGQDPESLRLHYHQASRLKIKERHIQDLLAVCADPSIFSFMDAYRRLAAPAATEAAYRRRLDPATYRRLIQVFELRREAARLSVRAGRLLDGVPDSPPPRQ